MTDDAREPKSDREAEPAVVPEKRPVPAAIQRLMNEVRNGTTGAPHAYDRGHNRHNRS